MYSTPRSVPTCHRTLTRRVVPSPAMTRSNSGGGANGASIRTAAPPMERFLTIQSTTAPSEGTTICPRFNTRFRTSVRRSEVRRPGLAFWSWGGTAGFSTSTDDPASGSASFAAALSDENVGVAASTKSNAVTTPSRAHLPRGWWRRSQLRPEPSHRRVRMPGSNKAKVKQSLFGRCSSAWRQSRVARRWLSSGSSCAS
jgi:hypothetical protein